MKKNVLKAMSVGLSAATIASTMSVPVYAVSDDVVVTDHPGVPAVVEEKKEEKPTNVLEKKAAKDANELDDKYYNEKDDRHEREKDKEVFDQVQDVEKAADEENFPDGSTYYYDVKTTPWGWPIGLEEVTYEDEAEKIEKVAEDAGKKIDCAADDLDTNVEAAKDMDTSAGKVNTALTTIETAASDATEKVNTAEASVAVAVESVDKKSTRQASIDVKTATEDLQTAEKQLEDSQAAYETAKQDYEDAKAEYNAACQGYRDSKHHAAHDLDAAEKKLNEARARVALLELSVKEAEKAYAESAAGHLYAANEFSKMTDGTPIEAWGDSENVRAIIQYYILEGKDAQLSAVKYIDNHDETKGDAEFEVTYFLNGRYVSERYGFAFNEDGTVDIYNTDVKYEYDSVAVINGETTTIQKTKAEMDEMVAVGAAVKRYEYRDFYGVHYVTEDELINKYHQNPRNYSYNYVIVLHTGTDEAWWDPMESNEKYDYEISREGWFDAWGNYHETIKNKTTKTIVKLVNGELTYEGTFENAPGQHTVEAKAAFELQGELEKEIDKIKKGQNENVKIDPKKIVDVEVVSVQNEDIAIVWTVEGTYVPLYKNANSCWCEFPEEKTHEEFVSVEKNTKVYSDMQLAALKKSLKEKYQKDNPNAIVNDVTVTYRKIYGTGYYWDTVIGWEILAATVNVVNSYEADSTKEFNSREEALASVLEDAKKDHVGCASHKENVTEPKFGWVDRNGYFHEPDGRHRCDWYNVIIGTTTVYDEEIVALGVGTKLQANADYEVEADYTLKVTYEKDDTATIFQNYATEKVQKIYRKTVSLLDNTAYAKRLAEIQKQVKSYKELITQAEQAKNALDSAKRDVDKLQFEVARLKKDREQWGNLIVWSQRLSDAEEALKLAQENYDTTKGLLDKASAKLKQRIAAENQNQGGEEQPSGGPAIISGIPEIASIPAVIPEEAVPLAAQTTRRTRRIAGVVEEEPVEEVVEETPAEEPEVTVEENENNPVVIDDEDVARAGGTQKSFFARTWWAWLLLVIAAIGGAVAYTKKKATDLK